MPYINHKNDADAFFQLTTQWKAFERDMETLSHKKPDGVVNPFKLKLANQLLASANSFLSADRRPIKDFELFDDAGSLTTNSDVVVVFSQYHKALSKLFREFTVTRETKGNHVQVWWINGAASEIPARMESGFG